MTDVVLAGELRRRRALATWGGVAYDCRERWFLARVATFALDTSRLSAEERTTIVGHRWWTIDELETTTDRLVPGRLVALGRDVLRFGVPTRPIDIGP